MKHLSWKYIAGLVDGEGCIDFRVNTTRYKQLDGSEHACSSLTPRLRVSLAAPSKFVLDLLHNQCGGHLSLSKRSHLNPVWQDAYCWTIENSRCRATLQEMKRFLLIKREQAELVIWTIDNLVGKQKDRTPNLQMARDIAKEELKVMKRDPQRLSEKAVERIKSALSTDAIVQTII